VGPHTRLHAYRVLHQAIRKALQWQVMDRDPMLAVKAPRPLPHDPEVLTLEEAQAFLSAFKGTEVEPAIVLALAAGLRRSEICGLDGDDIDLEAKTVRIRRGMHGSSKGDVWFEEPKSRTSRRVVSLPEWACAALSAHVSPDTPLLRVGGERMNPAALSARYVAYRDKFELRKVPLRDLRHTHATLALAAGVDVVVVSRRLGHSTIAVTDSYYLRPHRSADEAAAAAIESMAPLASGHSVPIGQDDTDTGTDETSAPEET